MMDELLMKIYKGLVFKWVSKASGCNEAVKENVHPKLFEAALQKRGLDYNFFTSYFINFDILS
jgi:hypothetical protein